MERRFILFRDIQEKSVIAEINNFMSEVNPVLLSLINQNKEVLALLAREQQSNNN